MQTLVALNFWFLYLIFFKVLIRNVFLCFDQTSTDLILTAGKTQLLKDILKMIKKHFAFIEKWAFCLLSSNPNFLPKKKPFSWFLVKILISESAEKWFYSLFKVIMNFLLSCNLHLLHFCLKNTLINKYIKKLFFLCTYTYCERIDF